jgi:phosphoglycerol transferase MdoB-like AlkP superfamily enzyme
MGFKEHIPDCILILLSILIALLTGSLLQGIGGHWAAIIALVVLFTLLYFDARFREWTAPFTLRVVRSSALSELFLSLALITAGLALSWFLGVVVSRTYSEVEGVLVSLCIFGVLMLVVSSGRNWQ